MAVWPTTMVAALGAAWVLPDSTWWLSLLCAGLVLGLPQIASYARRLSPAPRMAVKLLGGVGLGFVITAIVVAPVPVWSKVGAYGLATVAFVALQTIRVANMIKVCRACPWRMDWDHCPGFMGAEGVRPAGSWIPLQPSQT